MPTNLVGNARVSSTQVSLSWTASTDNVAVTGYNVYRDGAQVGTPTAPSFQDSGLAPATTYSYTVSARDAAGNVSPLVGACLRDARRHGARRDASRTRSSCRT